MRVSRHSCYRASGRSSRKKIPRLLGCPQLLRQRDPKRKKWYGKTTNCVWTWQNIKYNLGQLIERVVPAEWQVRTVLGDSISRAKVAPAQAPQYRRHALISDFLDLANLSIQEEAALATNWIKDQNLTSASKGRSKGSSPKNLTADVHYAINRCESLGPRRQFILHGNPSAIARDFSTHIAVL